MTDNYSLESILVELAPTPQKWRRAIRVASVTALGAGVTATLQLTNPLGLTMLVNLSLPEAAFPIARGVIFLFSAVVFQTVAVAAAAALANSPAIELGAFILLSLVSSYLIYAVPTLGRLWVWIQVPVVTAFYMVLFTPGDLGSDNVQMFAGMAIAVAMLLLLNNVFSPEPVRMELGDSLLYAVVRSRFRFAHLIAIAIGDYAGDQDYPLASQLGRHLALLSQVHQLSLGELARILGAVMRVERIHNQLDRLAVTVAQHPPAAAESSRQNHPLRAIARAMDASFESFTSEVRRQVGGNEKNADGRKQLPGSWELRPAVTRMVQNYPELADLAREIIVLSDLLAESNLEIPNGKVPDEPKPSMHGANPFLVRFTARHTLALTIAFLVGLWDNSVALRAAIWLLMLGGPPSHGATIRKFSIRALGSAGALALAALGTIVVAPNYASPVSYMAVIFIGVFLMTYIGEGGGILSYLAIGGTAFVIAYSGPGPRNDVLGSLWSIWGISLGMVIRAVLTLIWREYSYRTLAEEFQAPFAAIVQLLQAPPNLSNRLLAKAKVLGSIQAILGVANDALLEGRGAGIDADTLVETMDILLRLAFMISAPDRAGIDVQTAISQPVTDAIRLRFQIWLKQLNAETESGVVKPAPLRRMVLDAAVPRLNEMIARDETTAPEISLLTESDRRIVNLVLLLERKLTEISLEPAASTEANF